MTAAELIVPALPSAPQAGIFTLCAIILIELIRARVLLRKTTEKAETVAQEVVPNRRSTDVVTPDHTLRHEISELRRIMERFDDKLDKQGERLAGLEAISEWSNGIKIRNPERRNER